jgi:hypothetical protein
MSPCGGPITKFDDPHTSLSFFEYVGFSTMSDCVKFSTDIEFVSAYTQYRKIMKFVTGDSKAHMKALSWLYLYTEADGSRIFTDVDGDEYRDEHPIPSSIDAVWKKYGEGEEENYEDGDEDESNKSQYIGCLLYLVDEEFQRAASRYETPRAEKIPFYLHGSGTHGRNRHPNRASKKIDFARGPPPSRGSAIRMHSSAPRTRV